MAIKVTTSDRGSVTVMKVSGSVVLLDGAKEMFEAVAHQLQRGQKKIVLDMSEANFIDSSGLGYLVTAYTKVKNSGGELVMAAPSPKISDVMRNSKLDRIIKVDNSVDEAVVGLEKRPERDSATG
jgi:anti-sigma B factor antagonist